MKARLLTLTLILAGLGSGLAAQTTTDQYGRNKDTCLMYNNLYTEFYKQNNFQDAMPWWLKSVDYCPRYHVNLYIRGDAMFKHKIENETDEAKRQVLIDSLMWVYDKRIEHFGTNPKSPKGYVLGVKGIALQKYNTQEYAKSYQILKESIELMKSQSAAAVLLTYMQASRQLFLDGAITEEEVLSDYETTMEIAEANLKVTPEDGDFLQAKDGIESFFTSSGAANCDALTKLYTSKFGALQGDADWLKKITKQLRKAGCTDSQIFADAAEALFKIEPSSDAAHNISYIFLKKEEYEKAAEYLQQAIEMGQESEELADMYYELGTLNLSHFKDYSKAKNLADKAIAARPNWGKPYILLGQVFIGARDQMFSEDWDKKTVMWAAVDKFIKAKTVDPTVADQATDLINTYSEYFPNNEEVFFHTLRDGDTYVVKGWVNETTRVRSKRL